MPRADSSSALSNSQLDGVGLRLWCILSVRGRKFDHETRSALGPVTAGDAAPVLLKYAVTHTESQPRSLADRACRVEGIEDSGGLADSGAIVRELDAHRTFHGMSRDSKHPTVTLRHCVHRITDDLNKDLQKLIGISASIGQRVLEIHRVLSIRRLQLGPAKFESGLNHQVQVHKRPACRHLLGKA